MIGGYRQGKAQTPESHNLPETSMHAILIADVNPVAVVPRISHR
jgi:hypothetical protein